MNDVTTMVDTGRHRLEATISGAGLPAVVIEPAFGGSARAWQKIAETLAADTTVITYDRAPYGASSRASDGRTPGDVAADLHAMLETLAIPGPFVLVGHSIGGVYVRAYAARHMERVAGMVLVDSSHEGQQPVLRGQYSLPNRARLAFAVPELILRPKRWRGGADRRSIVREYRMLNRLGVADQALTPGALENRPLIVLTRGPRKSANPDRLWLAWRGLQQELAGLSANSRHVISESPRHYLNKGDPKLVISEIREVVRSARAGTPLGPEATASDGE